jgi:hypothetical protein
MATFCISDVEHSDFSLSAHRISQVGAIFRCVMTARATEPNTHLCLVAQSPPPPIRHHDVRFRHYNNLIFISRSYYFTLVQRRILFTQTEWRKRFQIYKHTVRLFSEICFSLQCVVHFFRHIWQPHKQNIFIPFKFFYCELYLFSGQRVLCVTVS